MSLHPTLGFGRPLTTWQGSFMHFDLRSCCLFHSNCVIPFVLTLVMCNSE